MTRPDSPLRWAEAACDTMMQTWAPEDLPPKGRFHYHQGVFLSGMEHTYRLNGREAYMDYIERWVRSVFDPEGRILSGVHADLDDIQPGILLFPLMDRSDDPFFAKCLESVMAEVRDIPRTAEGGWWHKTTLPNQLWLDGLYMAGPFCAEYARRYNRPDMAEDVVREAQLVAKHTRDEATGLWFHAWDGDRKTAWADPVTGRAPEFWGRSMGWVPVALLDAADQLPEGDGKASLQALAADLLRALCRFQSEDGRWYQVVNKGDQPGNWLENSCSCLYVAGLCRAVRRGVLPVSFLDAARRGYEGVIRDLGWEDGRVLVGNVCIGTGVGDYAFYCGRPVSVNDLHGVGAFLLMCTEMAQTAV